MLQSFIRNIINRLFLLLVLVFNFGLLQAQEKKTIPDVEKVYLHTDRSIYFVGEDLWYKAYNVNAYNNLLYDNSNVLYVELISADAKIVARNKTNLEVGLGHGDFQLKDSLGVKPGHYQLRAYTNWNRNFGEDFVFKKEIEIIDVLEDHSKVNKTQNGTTTTIKLQTIEANKQNTFKVDFFPEGGSLLENVTSIIGFKAVDTNGKPIEIKGELFDSNNELVTAFESVHDGMGKFQFVPIEDKKYFAKVQNPAGEEMKVELPSVLKQGYSLHFRTIKGRNIVSIQTNQTTLTQNPNGQLTVVCKAKVIPYLETTQTLTETSFSFELPKDKTPEGISQITVFDTTNKPQSERLIYIEKVKDLEVQLTTDKASYGPNEKVIVNVSSKSKTGEGKSASFSVSVTDRNGQMEEKDFNSNICSYFLMESDIIGKVHHPAYYFDTKNPKRLEHLDNLLLTQGWRDFLWKTMPKVDARNGYKAEKGITISGSVKQISTDKPLVNNNLTLGLIGNKDTGIFNATTDSLGYFQFEPLLFYGKKLMYLNTRDGKGNFQGKIVLDSIERSPVKIALKKEQIDSQESTAKIVENVFKKYGYLDVKSENTLENIVVVAKKKDRSTFLTGVSQITGEVGFSLPAFSYKNGKEVNISSITNIFDLIIKKIPNVRSFEKSVSFLHYDSPPLFTLNGDPNRPNVVTYEQIADISPSDVEDIFAVEDMRGGEWNGYDAPHGVIAIWTKPLAGNQFTKNPLSSINKKIDGFYTARVFYSPTPEQAELDNKLAVRNTLYWNPEVRPDKKGNATVNYYNTKVETKVKVALEGITATGIPVVRNVYYEIKN